MQAGRARTFELIAAALACCVVLLANAWAWCSCAAMLEPLRTLLRRAS